MAVVHGGNGGVYMEHGWKVLGARAARRRPRRAPARPPRSLMAWSRRWWWSAPRTARRHWVRLICAMMGRRVPRRVHSRRRRPPRRRSCHEAARRAVQAASALPATDQVLSVPIWAQLRMFWAQLYHSDNCVANLNTSEHLIPHDGWPQDHNRPNGPSRRIGFQQFDADHVDGHGERALSTLISSPPTWPWLLPMAMTMAMPRRRAPPSAACRARRRRSRCAATAIVTGIYQQSVGEGGHAQEGVDARARPRHQGEFRRG